MNIEYKVKVFRISGSFKQRRQTTSFSKEISAITEEQAQEKLFSEFGSRNRIKRGQIKIVNIEEIAYEEVSDPFVQKLINTDFKIPYED